MTDQPIQITELRKRFGTVRALDGLDLSVLQGEVAGFLGPNGAGKSTTIRALLGLLRADSGRARLFGRDGWTDAVALHRRIAYVPGDVSLWPNLTGGEAIDYLTRLSRTGPEASRKARRAELLERFDLDPTKKARTYSKGNRQKVALVAAFLADPDLYILDEPTSGLDPLMEAVFTEEVAAAKAEGRSVLLSSHILSEVEKLCDTVTIIRAGRTVESGTIAELRHLTRTAISATVASDPTGLGARPGVHDLTAAAGPDGTNVDLSVDQASLGDVLAALGSLGLQRLTAAPPSLEELFMRHYGGPGSPEREALPADRRTWRHESTLVGVPFVLSLLLRRDAARLAVWVGSLAAFCAFFLTGNRVVYRSAEDRLNRAASMSNPGGIFLTGMGYGLDNYTVGAMFANEMTIWLMVLLAVMNILQITRTTRDEEATGRAELVRSLPVGRHAPQLAAFGVVVLADAAFALVGSLVLVAFGLPVGDTIAMMAGVVATALVFAGLTTVTCQLTVHGRGASGMALGALGAAVLARGIGDTMQPHGNWLSWLSPLAWTQQQRAYVDLRLWPLALSALAILATLALGGALAGRRDLGGALLPERTGAGDAAPSLAGCFALAFRLQRAGLAWWLAACAAMFGATGLVVGRGFRDALAAIAAQNDITGKIFGSDPMGAFTSLMMVHNALAVAVYTVGATLRIKAEEDEGRLASTLARPVARTSVLLAHLAMVGLGVIGLVFAGGVLPLWLGSVLAGGVVDLRTLLISGGTLALAIIAMLAFTAAVYAWTPRLTGLASALFGMVVFETFFGGLLNVPDAIKALSPFWWAGDYPVTPVDPGRLAVLGTATIGLLVLAFVGFRRRDLTTG